MNSVTPKDNRQGAQACAHLADDPVLIGLLMNSPRLLTAIQSLIGRGNLEPPQRCQVAIQAPMRDPPWRTEELEESPPSQRAIASILPRSQWHIDGMGRKGETANHLFSPFTLLVGVALSDQLVPFCGNLVVFPNSHVVIHEIVRNRVRAELEKNTRLAPGKVNAGGEDRGLNSDSSGIFSGPFAQEKPVLAEPHHVLLRAGDAVLCHQRLAHRAGPNFSDSLRYQVRM